MFTKGIFYNKLTDSLQKHEARQIRTLNLKIMLCKAEQLSCRGIDNLLINYILNYTISLTLVSKLCIDKWPLSNGRRQIQAGGETFLFFTHVINIIWNIHSIQKIYVTKIISYIESFSWNVSDLRRYYTPKY